MHLLTQSEMVRLIAILALAGVLAGIYSQAPAQVYEFSKPNVPVNDDSLGRHHHFNTSQGQHLVAARGDTFYAGWWDYRRAGYPNNPDIFFARSTDSGRTFLPNVRVNDDPDSAFQLMPSLCLDKRGVIHVAWEDTRLGGYQIFYSRSTDGGRTFLPNLRISDSDTISHTPVVSSNGSGIVCVAWGQTGINVRLAQSSNGGQTFGRSVIVNDVFTAFPPYEFSLDLDSVGRAYVAWKRHYDANISLSRSTDPGDTLFYPSVLVSDSFPRPWVTGNLSVVVARNGLIYVAFEDKRFTSEALHVFVARSTDGGASFLPNVNVSDDPQRNGQKYPSVAADDSGNVYVAWEDYRDGYRCIYFARSRDTTATGFTSNILVNDTAGLAGTDRYGASLAVNERWEAFVTWSDNRLGGSNYDIFSSRGVRKQNGVEDNQSAFHDATDRISCYPNPFSSQVLIGYSVTHTERINLKVFNVLGEEVERLEEGPRAPGRYETEWRGVDEQGQGVVSGVYFVKLTAESLHGGRCSSETLQRIILLR